MTLVVGMHLGDSVGVVADSRVTIRYSDGRTKYLDNALKVYVCPPYFISAVAGDAFAATGFINSLSLRLMTEFTQNEVFAQSTNLDWMRDLMLQTYELDIETRLLEKTSRFACIFATENRTRLAELNDVPHAVSLRPSVIDSSFESSAKQLSRDAHENDKLRTVFSIRFPEGQIQNVDAGHALYLGSGSESAKNLSSMTTVMVPPAGMSHGDRLAAAAVDVSSAQRLSGDPSFNGIYFGMSLSCGVPETLLHGFNDWPNDSVPKYEYEWEDYHFEDVPELIPFSAGLDLAELNAGWIYDGGTKKRMKLQSFLDPEFINAHVKERSSSSLWIL